MSGGTPLTLEQNPLGYLSAVLEWDNEPTSDQLNRIAEFTTSPETDRDAFYGALYDLKAMSRWEYMRNALYIVTHCAVSGSSMFKEHAKGNVLRLISLISRTVGSRMGVRRFVHEKLRQFVQIIQPRFVDDLQRLMTIVAVEDQPTMHFASILQAIRLVQPSNGDHARMFSKLQQSFTILHTFTLLVSDPPPETEYRSGISSPGLPDAVVNLLLELGNYASHIERNRIVRARLREACGDDAQSIIDGLQAVLDAHTASNVPTSRASVLRLLQDLAIAGDILPQDYWLTDIEEEGERVGRGGEANIMKGVLWKDSRRIQIVLRVYRPEIDHITVRREAITQRQLKHSNILQFLGVFRMSDSRTAIITPLVPKGDASTYVKEHPGSDCFMQLVLGVSSAVCYIHGLDPPTIHGDIRGANILVDEDGNPQLCDFGLSRIKHEHTRSLTNLAETGYWRHLPPELLNPPPKFRTTPQSDVYSFAMTIYELGTRKLPFEDEPVYRVMNKLVGGERPHQPRNLGGLDRPLGNSLWSVIESMWKQDADFCPSASNVHNRLVQINMQRNPAPVLVSPSNTGPTIAEAYTRPNEKPMSSSLTNSLNSIRLCSTPDNNNSQFTPSESPIQADKSHSTGAPRRTRGTMRRDTPGRHIEKVAYSSNGDEFASGTSDGGVHRSQQGSPETATDHPQSMPEQRQLTQDMKSLVLKELEE